MNPPRHIANHSHKETPTLVPRPSNKVSIRENPRSSIAVSIDPYPSISI